VNRSDFYRRLIRLLHRAADISLVSNDVLAGVVERHGGRPFVLPDPLPAFGSPVVHSETRSPYLVAFVCSFAPDEPYLEVVEAARLLSDVATIEVTGRCPSRLPASAPENVRFTGYLPDAAYEELLRRADVVVDLTAMDDCLVCGAYEAVALEKPLVTSDTRALRHYFTRGTVFTRHDAASVAASIREAIERRQELSREMLMLRKDLAAAWAARRSGLVTELGAMVTR
jgi:glycosyltransferase involved in cell wall biosynthesis